MVFLFIWFGFAILCAIIAANKNRSAIGWFFLGLIFGFFALIVILVLGDPTRVQTIIINNQVAATAAAAPAPPPVQAARVEPVAPAPLLIEGARRTARRDLVADAQRLEPAVIALRTLAEAADAVDDGAVDTVLAYLEAENGDAEFTRREADQLVKWITSLPRDEASIRSAVDQVRRVIGDRAAFVAAVDRLEGTEPNDRQVKWANFLRRRAEA